MCIRDSFDTLSHWVQSAPLAGVPEPLPDSERRVLLHGALRDRGWFDEAALWGIATEMAELFDELTAAAVTLPENEAELAAHLQQAYALRASAPLVFEARVVHELWQALALAGQFDAAAVYRLRLAALVRQAEDASVSAPLLVLLDTAPDEALDTAERDFLQRYGQAQAVSVFHPAPRDALTSPLMATLAAAWPDAPGAPLFPVSYTHLDVYKRQRRSWQVSSDCHRCSAWPPLGDRRNPWQFHRGSARSSCRGRTIRPSNRAALVAGIQEPRWKKYRQ